MILTTPTKNLRKRSNTNTAVTYGVAFKNPNKKLRKQESEKPRNQETQIPRDAEAKKPRNQETEKPTDPETKKPRTMARCKMNAAAARTKCRHEVTALARWEMTPGALKNDLNTAL